MTLVLFEPDSPTADVVLAVRGMYAYILVPGLRALSRCKPKMFRYQVDVGIHHVPVGIWEDVALTDNRPASCVHETVYPRRPAPLGRGRAPQVTYHGISQRELLPGQTPKPPPRRPPFGLKV